MEHRALSPILPLPVTPSQFNLHYRGPTLNYFAGFDSKTQTNGARATDYEIRIRVEQSQVNGAE